MCLAEPVFPCNCAWNLPTQRVLFDAESDAIDGKIGAETNGPDRGALTPQPGPDHRSLYPNGG